MENLIEIDIVFLIFNNVLTGIRSNYMLSTILLSFLRKIYFIDNIVKKIIKTCLRNLRCIKIASENSLL